MNTTSHDRTNEYHHESALILVATAILGHRTASKICASLFEGLSTENRKFLNKHLNSLLGSVLTQLYAKNYTENTPDTCIETLDPHHNSWYEFAIQKKNASGRRQFFFTKNSGKTSPRKQELAAHNQMHRNEISFEQDVLFDYDPSCYSGYRSSSGKEKYDSKNTTYYQITLYTDPNYLITGAEFSVPLPNNTKGQISTVDMEKANSLADQLLLEEDHEFVKVLKLLEEKITGDATQLPRTSLELNNPGRIIDTSKEPISAPVKDQDQTGEGAA